MDRHDARPADADGGAPEAQATIVLVAGANDRFALGLTVALCSALRRLDPARPAHVFILDGGLSPASRDRCRLCLQRARPDAAITFSENDPGRFLGLNHHGYSRAAYLRLLIPEVVPDAYPRALYLDSDVVVEGDVAQLWALPDQGTAFWAALDDGIRGTSFVRDHLGFGGLAANAPYFNSGVMLIDLRRWKAARISERTLMFLAEHSDRCVHADQDALNIVAAGNWSVLPSAWNRQFSGMNAWPQADGAPGDPIGVIHFVDGKPWQPGTACLLQRNFNLALRDSGWLSTGAYLGFLARRKARAARFGGSDWLRRRPALARVWDAIRGRRTLWITGAPADN